MPDRPPRVFLSYKHEEASAEIVRQLIERLETTYDICADTDIRAGSEWRREIERWMRRSDAAVILLTPEYLRSEYCRYELSVLTHRRRSTQDRRGGLPRFEIFPYRVACSTEQLIDAAGDDPQRILDLEIEGNASISAVESDLTGLPRQHPRLHHARALRASLPSEGHVRRIADFQFDLATLGADAADPEEVVVNGLIERVDDADPDGVTRWPPLTRALASLAESYPSDDLDSFRDLCELTGARRIPYEEAGAIDSVTEQGRAFAIPDANIRAVELLVACAAATRWGRRPVPAEDLIVRVQVDADASGATTALDTQISEAINERLAVSAGTAAQALEKQWTFNGIPVTVLLEPPPGDIVPSSVLIDIRQRFPWCNVLVLTGDAQPLPGWADRAQVDILNRDERPLDAFCAAFDEHVTDIMTGLERR